MFCLSLPPPGNLASQRTGHFWLKSVSLILANKIYFLEVFDISFVELAGGGSVPVAVDVSDRLHVIHGKTHEIRRR